MRFSRAQYQLPWWSSGWCGDFDVGYCGFETQPNLILCWFNFDFYWRIVFIKLFRYILKLTRNSYFKFEKICPGICSPRKYLNKSSKWLYTIILMFKKVKVQDTGPKKEKACSEGKNTSILFVLYSYSLIQRMSCIKDWKKDGKNWGPLLFPLISIQLKRHSSRTLFKKRPQIRINKVWRNNVGNAALRQRIDYFSFFVSWLYPNCQAWRVINEVNIHYTTILNKILVFFYVWHSVYQYLKRYIANIVYIFNH